jgi:hypothetical protein
MTPEILKEQCIKHDLKFVENGEVFDLMHGNERIAHIQKRQHYCDRGHWVGIIEICPNLDGQDHWPNYYMRLEVAKEEMLRFFLWRLFKIRSE